jgi:virulence factor Mce-like protein
VRRLGLLALAAAAIAALAVLVTGAGGGDGDRVRVDAIFDNTAFLVEGQDVKVAGAPVGKVVGFSLTKDNQARVEMEVDERFAPFRSGASCNVQPQSLIGDRFVQCSPGRSGERELVSKGGKPPTVPLGRTSAPVDIDLLLSPLRLPVRQRLSLLVSGLGAGLAGRPADLNAALRRANPALGETRRVLRIVERDRDRIAAIVGESDRIIGALARRKGDVAEFVDTAAGFTSATAARRTELAAAIRRLPPLLAEAEPSLRAVGALASDGTPLVRDLRRSAAPLDRVAAALPGFSAGGRPALTSLARLSDRGVPALRAAAPDVRRLRGFAADARPAGSLAQELLASARDAGSVEGLLQFVAFGARALARKDKTSHILGAFPVAPTGCEVFTGVRNKACDSHFQSTPFRAAAKPRGAAKPRAARAPAPRSAAPDPQPILDYLLR